MTPKAQTTKEKTEPGILVHTCNPRTPLVQGQSGIHSKTMSQKNKLDLSKLKTVIKRISSKK
jgi:hypothetical protein